MVAKFCHPVLHIFGNSDAHHKAFNAKCTIWAIVRRPLDIHNNGIHCQQFWTTDRIGTLRHCKHLNHQSIFFNEKIIIYPFFFNESDIFYFQIKFGASVLTICGNIVVYLTIFGYFLFLDPDETTYGGMA